MDEIEWERLKTGDELEPFVKAPIEKVQLLKYAGASGDYNLYHIDVDTAKEVGLPGIIAHGMLSMAFLGEYAGKVAGTKGFVKKIKVRFGGMVFPGDALICKMKVIRKDETEKTVDFAISAERVPGKPITSGEATIKFF